MESQFPAKGPESCLMTTKEGFAKMLGLQKRNPARQPRKPENVPWKQQNNALEQTVLEQKLTEKSDSSSSANGNLDGAHDTGSHVLPHPVSSQPVQISQWGGGNEFLSLFSHVPAPNGAPHPFASSWQDWVQRSNPPNVMGQGAYGNAREVNNVGYGMRPQPSSSTMNGRGGMNMNEEMGGMDAPQNSMLVQHSKPLHVMGRGASGNAIGVNNNIGFGMRPQSPSSMHGRGGMNMNGGRGGMDAPQNPMLVQHSKPPHVMGRGASGNAMGVNNIGFGMRPQSPSSMHGRGGMNMNGGRGGMDAPQNLMPWAAASQSFSTLNLPDPVLTPHASLSERRDYLLGASLPPPRFVEDINFMVPLVPPSAMSFNERLRHKLDLENRFSPPQQSNVFKTTLQAESGGPLNPRWPIKLSRPEERQHHTPSGGYRGPFEPLWHGHEELMQWQVLADTVRSFHDQFFRGQLGHQSFVFPQTSPLQSPLTEQRDNLLAAAALWPPLPPREQLQRDALRDNDDMNYLVPSIPPDAIPFKNRLKHTLGLEHRFSLQEPSMPREPPPQPKQDQTSAIESEHHPRLRPNHIPISREPLHDAVVKWDRSGAVQWATTASHIEERDADLRNHVKDIVTTIKSAFDPGAAKVLKDVNIQTDLQSSTIEYLDQVKLAFGNNPEIYSKFLDIMKDYRASVINTQQVIESVGCLFHGHQLLVQGLAGFLPHIQTERQRQQELLQLSDKQLKSQWVTAQDKSRGPSSTPNPTHPSSTLQPTSTSRGLQSTPIWPLSPPRKKSEKVSSPSFDKSLGSLEHTVDTVARFLALESVLQSQEVSPEDLLLKVDGLNVSQMTSRQVHTILKLDDLYSVVELTLQRRRSGELYTLKVRRAETKKPQHFVKPMTLPTIDDSIAEDKPRDKSKEQQHFVQPKSLPTIVDSIAEDKSAAGADKQKTQKPELQDVVAAPGWMDSACAKAHSDRLEDADILAIFDEEAENDIRTLLHKHISRTRSQDAEIIEQLSSFYSQFNPAKAGQAEGIWKAIKKDYQANALAETNRALEKKYGCNLSTWKARSEVAKPEPNAGHSFLPEKTYTTLTNERAERSGARPSAVRQPTSTSRGMPSAPSWPTSTSFGLSSVPIWPLSPPRPISEKVSPPSFDQSCITPGGNTETPTNSSPALGPPATYLHDAMPIRHQSHLGGVGAPGALSFTSEEANPKTKSELINFVLMNLRLNMIFEVSGPEGSIQRQNFIQDLKQDLADASGMETSHFNILKLSRGSVVVDMNAPETAVQEIQRQSLDSSSKLRSGRVTRFTESVSIQNISFDFEADHVSAAEPTALPTINGSIAEDTLAAGAGEQSTHKSDAEIIDQLNSFYSQFNPTKAGQAEQVWKELKKRYQVNALAEINKALVDKYGCDLSTWNAQSEVVNPEPKISAGVDADDTGAAATAAATAAAFAAAKAEARQKQEEEKRQQEALRRQQEHQRQLEEKRRLEHKRQQEEAATKAAVKEAAQNIEEAHMPPSKQNNQRLDAEIIDQLNSFFSQFNPTKAGQAEQVWKDVKQGLPAATALAEINKALVDKYGCDLNTWKAQSEVAKPGTKICVGFDADHTGAAETAAATAAAFASKAEAALKEAAERQKQVEERKRQQEELRRLQEEVAEATAVLAAAKAEEAGQRQKQEEERKRQQEALRRQQEHQRQLEEKRRLEHKRQQEEAATKAAVKEAAQNIEEAHMPPSKQNHQRLDAEIIDQLNSFFSQFNPTKAGQAEQVWKDVKQGLPAATALAEINKALVDKYGCDLNTWKAQSEVAKPGTKICVGFDADHTGAAKTVEAAARVALEQKLRLAEEQVRLAKEQAESEAAARAVAHIQESKKKAEEEVAAAKRLADQEAAARKKAERAEALAEAARAEKAAAEKRAKELEEELARTKRTADEAKNKAEEEAKKAEARAKEAEESQKLQEEIKRQQEAKTEEAKKKAEEEAAAAKKLADQEAAARKRAEEDRKRAQDAAAAVAAAAGRKEVEEVSAAARVALEQKLRLAEEQVRLAKEQAESEAAARAVAHIQESKKKAEEEVAAAKRLADQEAAARKKAEEEEAARKKAEALAEAARAEKAAAEKRAKELEEELARTKRTADEAKKKAEEEAKKAEARAKEAEESQKLQEEIKRQQEELRRLQENQRQLEEQRRLEHKRQQEEAAKKAAAEKAAQEAAALAAAKAEAALKEAAERQKQEEERKRKQEELRRLQEETAETEQKLRLAEEQVRLAKEQAESEAAARAVAHIQESKKKAEEEVAAAKRLADQEAAARKKAEEEEAARKKAEALAEAARAEKAAAEKRAKELEEELARTKRTADEAKKKAEEEAKKAEARAKEAEESQKLQEEIKRQQEELRRLQENQRQLEEQRRLEHKRQQEEAAKKAAAEKAAQEAAALAAAKAEAALKEAAERQKQEEERKRQQEELRRLQEGAAETEQKLRLAEEQVRLAKEQAESEAAARAVAHIGRQQLEEELARTKKAADDAKEKAEADAKKKEEQAEARAKMLQEASARSIRELQESLTSLNAAEKTAAEKAAAEKATADAKAAAEATAAAVAKAKAEAEAKTEEAKKKAEEEAAAAKKLADQEAAARKRAEEDRKRAQDAAAAVAAAAGRKEVEEAAARVALEQKLRLAEEQVRLAKEQAESEAAARAVAHIQESKKKAEEEVAAAKRLADQEAAARKKAEEEEAARKKAEALAEAARAEKAAAEKRAKELEEELARTKRTADEAKKKAEEEAKKAEARAKEAEESQKLQEEIKRQQEELRRLQENQRQLEEQRRLEHKRQQEEAAKKAAAEKAAQEAAALAAAKAEAALKEAAERQKQEEERKRKQEELRRLQEETAETEQKLRLAEEQVRLAKEQAESEAAARAVAHIQESKKKAEEEVAAAKRLADQEAAARKKAEEEEAARKKAEALAEAARAEKAAAEKRAKELEEELARTKRTADEAKKKAEEEAKKAEARAKEAEESQKLQEEIKRQQEELRRLQENQRQLEEQRRLEHKRQQEEAAKKAAAEKAAQEAAALAAAKAEAALKEVAERQKQEEERKRKQEELRRLQEETAETEQKLRLAEEQVRLAKEQAESEAAARAVAHIQESKKKAEEEVAAAKRLADQEAAARKKAEEEEAARKKAEALAEAARAEKAAAEKRAKELEEELARTKRTADEAKKKAEEEAKKAEARAKEAEESQKLQEEIKRQQEELRRLQENQRQLEEQRRLEHKRQQEEAAKKAAAEKAAQEAAALAAAKAEAALKEAAERQKQEDESKRPFHPFFHAVHSLIPFATANVAATVTTKVAAAALTQESEHNTQTSDRFGREAPISPRVHDSIEVPAPPILAGSAGVGVLLFQEEPGADIEIHEIHPSGAAGRDGSLQVGDVLVALNSWKCAGLPFDKVHPHFLGPEGSEIELRVKRKINFSRIIEVFDVKLRRSRIENSRTASTTSSRSARSHAPSTASQARRKDSLAE